MVFPILGSGKRDQYLIDNSLRLDDGSTQYLSFKPTSSGSDMVGTMSYWTKKTSNNLNQLKWCSGCDTSNGTEIYIYQDLITRSSEGKTIRVGLIGAGKFG